MIERYVHKHHKINVRDEDDEAVVWISIEQGEILINIKNDSPEIHQAKEFHQALGEAIAIAEAQDA